MPHNRYYVDTPSFAVGDTVTLADQEAHHLLCVMRSKEGDISEIINGRGALATCKVTQVEKKRALLLVQSVETQKEPLPSIIVALSLLRATSLEWAIEKSVELGASQFWLFAADKSEKEFLSENQKNRLQAIAISASKQCGRLHIPEIVYKEPLRNWSLEKECAGKQLLVCDLSPQVLFLADVQIEKERAVLLFVGPEGGFSEKEKERLSLLAGSITVRLHPNILRAETAPIAALTLLRAACITK